MTRINRTDAVTLLGAIVDPEWAEMWSEDGNADGLRELAVERRSDARALDLIADMLEAT